MITSKIKDPVWVDKKPHVSLSKPQPTRTISTSTTTKTTTTSRHPQKSNSNQRDINSLPPLPKFLEKYDSHYESIDESQTYHHPDTLTAHDQSVKKKGPESNINQNQAREQKQHERRNKEHKVKRHIVRPYHPPDPIEQTLLTCKDIDQEDSDDLHANIEESKLSAKFEKLSKQQQQQGVNSSLQSSRTPKDLAEFIEKKQDTHISNNNKSKNNDDSNGVSQKKSSSNSDRFGISKLTPTQREKLKRILSKYHGVDIKERIINYLNSRNREIDTSNKNDSTQLLPKAKEKSDVDLLKEFILKIRNEPDMNDLQGLKETKRSRSPMTTKPVHDHSSQDKILKNSITTGKDINLFEIQGEQGEGDQVNIGRLEKIGSGYFADSDTDVNKTVAQQNQQRQQQSKPSSSHLKLTSKSNSRSTSKSPLKHRNHTNSKSISGESTTVLDMKHRIQELELQNAKLTSTLMHARNTMSVVQSHIQHTSPPVSQLQPEVELIQHDNVNSISTSYNLGKNLLEKSTQKKSSNSKAIQNTHENRPHRNRSLRMVNQELKSKNILLQNEVEILKQQLQQQLEQSKIEQDQSIDKKSKSIDNLPSVADITTIPEEKKQNWTQRIKQLSRQWTYLSSRLSNHAIFEPLSKDIHHLISILSKSMISLNGMIPLFTSTTEETLSKFGIIMMDRFITMSELFMNSLKTISNLNQELLNHTNAVRSNKKNILAVETLEVEKEKGKDSKSAEDHIYKQTIQSLTKELEQVKQDFTRLQDEMKNSKNSNIGHSNDTIHTTNTTKNPLDSQISQETNTMASTLEHIGQLNGLIREKISNIQDPSLKSHSIHISILERMENELNKKEGNLEESYGSGLDEYTKRVLNMISIGSKGVSELTSSVEETIKFIHLLQRQITTLENQVSKSNEDLNHQSHQYNKTIQDLHHQIQELTLEKDNYSRILDHYSTMWNSVMVESVTATSDSNHIIESIQSEFQLTLTSPAPISFLPISTVTNTTTTTTITNQSQQQSSQQSQHPYPFSSQISHLHSLLTRSHTILTSLRGLLMTSKTSQTLLMDQKNHLDKELNTLQESYKSTMKNYSDYQIQCQQKESQLLKEIDQWKKDRLDLQLKLERVVQGVQEICNTSPSIPLESISGFHSIQDVGSTLSLNQGNEDANNKKSNYSSNIDLYDNVDGLDGHDDEQKRRQQHSSPHEIIDFEELEKFSKDLEYELMNDMNLSDDNDDDNNDHNDDDKDNEDDHIDLHVNYVEEDLKEFKNDIGVLKM